MSPMDRLTEIYLNQAKSLPLSEAHDWLNWIADGHVNEANREACRRALVQLDALEEFVPIPEPIPQRLPYRPQGQVNRSIYDWVRETMRFALIELAGGIIVSIEPPPHATSISRSENTHFYHMQRVFKVREMHRTVPRDPFVSNWGRMFKTSGPLPGQKRAKRRFDAASTNRTKPPLGQKACSDFKLSEFEASAFNLSFADHCELQTNLKKNGWLGVKPGQPGNQYTSAIQSFESIAEIWLAFKDQR